MVNKPNRVMTGKVFGEYFAISLEITFLDHGAGKTRSEAVDDLISKVTDAHSHLKQNEENLNGLDKYTYKQFGGYIK